MLSSGTKHTNKDDRRSSKYKSSLRLSRESIQSKHQIYLGVGAGQPDPGAQFHDQTWLEPQAQVCSRAQTHVQRWLHSITIRSPRDSEIRSRDRSLPSSIQGLQDTYGVPGGRVQSRHWSVQRAPLSRGYAAAPPQDSDCYQGAGPSPAPAGHLANHRGSSLSPDGTTGGTSGSPLENRHSSIDEDRRDCQDTQTTTRPWGQRHLQDRIRRGQLQGILEIFYPRQTCRELKKRLSEHVAAYNKRYQQSPFKMGNGPPARLETGRGRALRHWV